MPSSIPYCDETWNVVTGCSHVQPGCEHCWAERLAATRLREHPHYKGLTTLAGRWTGEVRLNYDILEQPLHWRKSRRVFVASTGDLFHEKVPGDFLADVYDVMGTRPQHTFMVFTKRPQNLAWLYEERTNFLCGEGDYLSNVWHLASACDQESVDAAVPHLLKLKDNGWPIVGLSLEPLLGPVNLELCPCTERKSKCILRPELDWVIVGGESGKGARPMNPDWVRSIRDQCVAAGVPWYYKQGPDDYWPWSTQPVLDGCAWREMPEVKG